MFDVVFQTDLLMVFFIVVIICIHQYVEGVN